MIKLITSIRKCYYSTPWNLSSEKQLVFKLYISFLIWNELKESTPPRQPFYRQLRPKAETSGALTRNQRRWFVGLTVSMMKCRRTEHKSILTLNKISHILY